MVAAYWNSLAYWSDIDRILAFIVRILEVYCPASWKLLAFAWHFHGVLGF